MGKVLSAIFKVPPLVIALVVVVVGAFVVAAAVVGAVVFGAAVVCVVVAGTDVVGVALEQAPNASPTTSKMIIRIATFFTLIPPP